ncbi:hypothetical protein [Paraburkholderia sediminicola]|uniref:hypothetical protein n=1 Tax=Paraburkholderia sediminicola TaxID=458836 RepID=UPI0038BCEBE6
MDSARRLSGLFSACRYNPRTKTGYFGMKGKIADGEARERLIVWIRRRMQEFGITFDALEASIQEDLAHPPLYRDARGHDWNGVGPMPDWLTAAKHAGVDPDFFRIEVKPKEEPQRKGDVVYRQTDLFE